MAKQTTTYKVKEGAENLDVWRKSPYKRKDGHKFSLSNCTQKDLKFLFDNGCPYVIKA